MVKKILKGGGGGGGLCSSCQIGLNVHYCPELIGHVEIDSKKIKENAMLFHIENVNLLVKLHGKIM